MRKSTSRIFYHFLLTIRTQVQTHILIHIHTGLKILFKKYIYTVIFL